MNLSPIRSRVVSLAVIVALAVGTVACNARQTAIDALVGASAAAIALNQQIDPTSGQPALSTADTGAALTYFSQAINVLQAQPSGWKVTVQTAWSAAMTDVSKNHPTLNTKLATALGIITAAINSL